MPNSKPHHIALRKYAPILLVPTQSPSVITEFKLKLVSISLKFRLLLIILNYTTYDFIVWDRYDLLESIVELNLF